MGRGAVRTGKSTGAPGAVAMLALAQAEHGKLKWGDLFGEAIHLAEDGFPNGFANVAKAARDGATARKGGQTAGFLARVLSHKDISWSAVPLYRAVTWFG